MFKKFLLFVKEFVKVFNKNSIPRASAALSYYLTFSVFPLIICLYTLLGSNYQRAVDALGFISRLWTPQVIGIVNDFMDYVYTSYSNAMLAAGLAVLITSASAAFRSIQATIGDMQGGQRFQGFMYFIFSIVFSLMFLAGIYFSLLVILLGKDILALINSVVPFVDISSSWNWLRFLLLGGIFFLLIWAIYVLSKRKTDMYRTFPGALTATIGVVVMSLVFSIFIGASAKYPLVYGSLASIILLMFWLFICSQIIYVGAALNIALRNLRIKSGKYD